jgi:hypothetical protein
LGGTHNTIDVEHHHDRIVCRLSRRTRLLILAVTFFFGPTLLALLWFRPLGTIDLATKPVLFAAWILAIPLIASALFVHYLFTQRRMEVLRSSGAIELFKRNWGGAYRRIEKHEIQGFSIEEELFRASYRSTTTNYVLCVLCRDGKEVPLCISADANIIRALEYEIQGGVNGVRSNSTVLHSA